uniref:Heme-binding protein 2 n=1 Tax=Vannella robusta TaxID=1487602 RepID=A0A7S4ISC4_9EUKA|mmetsp:Transcript_7822/g.9696  ORF Transcript_7822/g.9696 Transcript_7822/m.9696 type:complete len:210 (+) Transcript_7822:93-722(+)
MKLLVILCVAIVAGFVVANESIPECDRYDCPSYSLLYNNQTASIQIREYEAARWARTKVQSFYYEKAVNIGFNRLFDYITGENADGIDIDMTAPVAVQVIPGPGPFCESTFIISFYVPSAYQEPNAAPPAPTSSNVYIETLPETTKAVQMFPGYVTQWNELVEPISELVEFCDEQGYQYVSNVETVCGYDSPFHVANRHNEIWIDVWNY